MSKFIQRFLRAWRDAKTEARYDLMVMTGDFWTNSDAEYMRSVFSSSTGKKFQAKLSNYVYECAISAIREPKDQAYHNGIARGADMTVVAIIDNFARSQRTESTSEEPSPSGVAAFGFN